MSCLQCKKHAHFYCGGCLKAKYCSQACAKINWEQNHKDACLYIGVKIKQYDADDVYTHFIKYVDQDEYLDNQIADIFKYPIWIRKDILISNTDWEPESVSSEESQNLIEYYKTFKTKQPAVILVPGLSTKPYRIVDGYHRISVAVSKQKKSVLAFVPLDSNKKFKK